MRDFLNDPETLALIALATHIFLVAVTTVLVSMNRRPPSAIAWVLGNILIPLLGAVAYLFVGYSKLPMVKDNSAELLPDDNGTFDAMIAEIETAESYVHVEFYILVLDSTTEPLFQALARDSRRSPGHGSGASR